MNPLKLFYCQPILLIILYGGCLCQNDNVLMTVSEVRVVTYEGDQGSEALFHDQPLAKTSPDKDEYFFVNDKLSAKLGGKFTSKSIDIMYAFGRALKFALTNVDKYYIIVTCKFSPQSDIHLLFSELRKTESLGVEGKDYAKLDKLFQYSIGGSVAQLASDCVFYRKSIKSARTIGADYSFNLVRMYAKRNEKTGAVTQVQEVDLVFLTGDYNITAVIGNDKLGICVTKVPPNISMFVLRFSNRSEALSFYGSMIPNANYRIPCGPDDTASVL